MTHNAITKLFLYIYISETFTQIHWALPIIDKEIFEKVQAERSRHTNIEITADGKKRKSEKYSSKRPNFDKIYDDK